MAGRFHSREEVQGHLRQLAGELKLALTDPQFAAALDARDELAHFREKFHIPLIGELLEEGASSNQLPPGVEPEKEGIYFVGNSLGLQPKSASKKVQAEMNDWAHKYATLLAVV